MYSLAHVSFPVPVSHSPNAFLHFIISTFPSSSQVDGWSVKLFSTTLNTYLSYPFRFLAHFLRNRVSVFVPFVFFNIFCPLSLSHTHRIALLLLWWSLRLESRNENTRIFCRGEEDKPENCSHYCFHSINLLRVISSLKCLPIFQW